MHPVTVIIPHFNEHPGRLAASVRSALNAGAGDVVVVDDGSDVPPTPPLVVRLVRQKHKGIAAALNLGAAMAKHGHVCWLSCGDTMHPAKLDEQMRVAAPSFHDFIDTSGVPKDRIAATNWRSRLWYDNQFCLSTAMVTRKVIDTVGGWDESLTYMVDWDFALRVELAIGWTRLQGIWGTAGEHEGGHTDRAKNNPQRQLDRRVVVKWARKHERLSA